MLMKPLILTTFFICVLINLNAQAQTVDYMKKAKKQKTVGFILLGTGVALATVGLILEGRSSDSVSGAVEDTFEGAGLIVGGAVVSAASIPFFIASGRNKKRSLALSPAIQKITGPADNQWANMQPAIKVSLNLGR